MDSVKNRGRIKLFMCFRPVTIDDDLVKQNRTEGSGDPVFTYISVQGKERMALPKILTSLSEEKLKVSSDGGDAGGAFRYKERSRRKLSRVLKAVLFENSLARKVRRRKARKTKKVSNSVNEKPTYRESIESDDPKTNSSRWSSLNASSSTTASTSLCSSFASSVSSDSRSSSDRKGSFRECSVESKQIDRLTSTKKVRENHISNFGLCLLLICLLVLIFWGKLCAILCTSMSLFLFPGRIKRVDSPGHGIDSPEHKKRVIMEGLLERNRCRI